jgi:hypothetical protein
MSSSAPVERAINWYALGRLAIGLLGFAALSYFVLFVIVATGAVGGESAVWTLFEGVIAVGILVLIFGWMKGVRDLLREIRDRLPPPPSPTPR